MGRDRKIISEDGENNATFSLDEDVIEKDVSDVVNEMSLIYWREFVKKVDRDNLFDMIVKSPKIIELFIRIAYSAGYEMSEFNFKRVLDDMSDEFIKKEGNNDSK